MLEPILSTLKYEISLFNKLEKSEFRYYSIYIFTLILKHFSDYTISKQIGKPVSTFDYLDELKKANFITQEEEKIIENYIAILRRKDRLIEKQNEVDLESIKTIINRIRNILEK